MVWPWLEIKLEERQKPNQKKQKTKNRKTTTKILKKKKNNVTKTTKRVVCRFILTVCVCLCVHELVVCMRALVFV